MLALAQTAFAGSITVSYSGSIYYSSIPNISVADTFSGYFTYSLPSPVLSDGSPTEITYSMDQPNNALYFSVGGYWFAAGPSVNLGLTAWSDYPAGTATDNFLSVVQNIGSSGSDFSTNYASAFTIDQIDAQLFGSPGFLQSNVPPDPFNASDIILGPNGGYFSAAGIDLQQGGSTFAAFGLIDNIQATETPEPASIPLCGIGLALIVLKRVIDLRQVTDANTKRV